MTRAMFRRRRPRHERKDVRRRKGTSLRELRARKYVQPSLDRGLSCQARMVTLNRRKGLRNEKLY